MPKTDLLTIKGEKAGKISLPEEIFAAKINPQLMTQAVRVYLSNQRRAHPKVKTRAEVNRTKAKWYRQKGTGRARHGSRAAPIFVGGGVSHGPKGVENYTLKMSKKMKKAALFSALTAKFKNGDILVIKGLEKVEPKTKKMAEVLEKLKLGGVKILLVLPGVLANVIRVARNIEGVNLAQANSLNTYEALNQDKVVFMKESVDKLKEIFLKE